MPGPATVTPPYGVTSKVTGLPIRTRYASCRLLGDMQQLCSINVSGHHTTWETALVTGVSSGEIAR